MNKKKTGILAIQGSVAEHENILKKLNTDYILVRSKQDIEDLTHIILPGGESTTISKLLKGFGMWEVLEHKIKTKDIQVFGTCAGAILCNYFGLDIEINRNGFGAQQGSFVADLDSKKFPDLKGVFIRAPRFASVGKGVEILAEFEGESVFVEKDNFLAISFHPEISGDTRIHEYFLQKQLYL